MGEMSIATKIFVVVLVEIIISTVILTTQSTHTIKNMANDDIQRYETQVIEAKKLSLQNYVELAKDVLQLYKNKVTSTTTEEQLLQIKNDAVKAIDSMLYGDDTGYIFVWTFDGVPLAYNTRPDLVGKNLLNIQGGGGKFVIKDLIKIAKETDGGFYEYQWRTVKDSPYQRKISYVYGDKDWKWMIGTGEYLANEELEIAYKKEQILTNTKHLVNTTLLSALALILIVALILFIVMKSIINKPLQNLQNGLDNFFAFLKNKEKKILPIKIISNDEIGNMTQSINENISVSAQLHKDIEEQKLRFQLAIEGSNDGLFDWDVAHDTIYFSSRWKSMLGYEKEEIEDSFNEWLKRVHIDDKETLQNDITAHFEGKTEVYENTHRLQHKNGSWVWILSRGKAHRDNTGKVIRMVGSHSDVTEITNYRNSLQQKVQEQLEIIRSQDHQLLEQAKLASLGGMLSNIAHQWSQPLHIISTSVSNIMLQKEFDELTLDEVVEHMEIITKQIEYLSNTIETFRGFVSEDENFKELNLQKAITSTLDIVRSSFENDSIEIQDMLDYKQNTILELSESGLSQVLLNIFTNAKDILIKNKIKNPWVKIILEDNEDEIILSIEDNGGGIAQNDIKKVFEPYFTTKHKAQGIGLSLHTSYKIVTESFHGKLYVKNTENGAKFFIELPRKR